MHPPRPALLRAAAGVLSATALLVACTGGADTPAARESPSAIVSDPTPAAPASTEAAEPSRPSPPPVPQPPRPRPGPEGQRAFARHVIASWAWSLHANDATPLLEASRSARRPCTGCRELARELRTRHGEQWYVDLPTLGVHRTRLRRDGEDVVASSRVDIPESDTYFYDGTFRSTSPAHDDATFSVRMRRAGERYVLVSFTVS